MDEMVAFETFKVGPKEKPLKLAFHEVGEYKWERRRRYENNCDLTIDGGTLGRLMLEELEELEWTFYPYAALSPQALKVITTTIDSLEQQVREQTSEEVPDVESMTDAQLAQALPTMAKDPEPRAALTLRQLVILAEYERRKWCDHDLLIYQESLLTRTLPELLRRLAT
jgi:hypothetical protein